MERTGIEYLD